jgi:hypothetical protein
MASSEHASQSLCELIDYLTGYVTREAMVCFETALNPVVKERLENHFPEDPARTAARKILETALLQLETDLDSLLATEKVFIQHKKKKQEWTGQSKAEMTDQKKILNAEIKRTKQELNEKPVQYVAECRSVNPEKTVRCRVRHWCKNLWCDPPPFFPSFPILPSSGKHPRIQKVIQSKFEHKATCRPAVGHLFYCDCHGGLSIAFRGHFPGSLSCKGIPLGDISSCVRPKRSQPSEGIWI